MVFGPLLCKSPNAMSETKPCKASQRTFICLNGLSLPVNSHMMSTETIRDRCAGERIVFQEVMVKFMIMKALMLDVYMQLLLETSPLVLL